MSRSKAVLSAFIAVLAMSAVVAASSSAAPAGWMVNGTLLASGSTAALATTAKVDQEAILSSVAANTSLLCAGGNLIGVNGVLEGGNMASVTSLSFTNCKALTSNCTVNPTTILTVPLLVEATLEGALAVTATFKPQTKSVFATFKFEGEKCASAGSDAVTGAASVLAPVGQDENTLQLINATNTEASGLLKVASSGASLTGSALLQLANGQPWSFL